MTEDHENAPESAADFHNLLDRADRYIKPWNDRADRIDQIYSQSRKLAGLDNDFSLFWSNIQVMLPAIYARQPIPVVSTKFMGRDRVYAVASEFLERNVIVSFDRSEMNGVMLGLRDDLAIIGRGVAWVRYEDDGDECIKYEWLDRKDFLHDPARKWCDVQWVARRAWLTHEQMKDRFGREIANDVDYTTRSDSERSSTTPESPVDQCGVWEIWHKSQNRVVWVVEGYDKLLDSEAPHLKLEGFFPCPEPAYATRERNTLIPVPDYVYYQGQLEEVNSLTRRIAALGEALRLRGFYPAGGEIGDAIETAMGTLDDGKIMVPISSMAAFGTDGGIVWIPIDMVATTLTACVELRRQLMEDVYQIIGLSDIMRGQSHADETATAQQIKQQNGSYRVRDKQQMLVRIARDMARIGAEIMAEKFDRSTLEKASQMTLPTDRDVKRQVADLEKQAKAELQGMMEQAQEAIMQNGGQPPEGAEQQFQQAQQQALDMWARRIKDAGEQVTIDAVIGLLRDENLRPYALDIETDSTIYPDEAQEKAARGELLQVFFSTTQALTGLMASGANGAKLAGEMLKFALAPYRVGRVLDGAIDDFIQTAPQELAAQQGEGEDSQAAMAQLAEAEMQKARAQMAKVEADSMLKQAEMQTRMAQMQMEMQEKAARLQLENDKLALAAQKQEQEFAAKMADMDAKQNLMQAQTAEILARIGLDVRKQDLAEYQAAEETQARQVDQAMSIQGQTFNEGQAMVGNARADRSEDRADRQQAFGERKSNV